MAFQAKMTETPSNTCSLKELYKVEDLKAISKCFAKLHANIGAEFCQFRKKLKETIDRVVELEKAMSHFENEQLGMKESTIPGIIEEAEKHNKSIRDEVLALNLWGRKWNFIVHGMTGEIKETSEVTRHRIQEFFNTTLKMDPGEVKNINIAACHRIRGSRDATKESIIIRFVDLQQRDYILTLAKKLPKGSGYEVMVDLSPELSKLRRRLLKKKSELPFQQQKETKLKYLQKAPFIQLVVAGQVQASG